MYILCMILTKMQTLDFLPILVDFSSDIDFKRGLFENTFSSKLQIFILYYPSLNLWNTENKCIKYKYFILKNCFC